MNGYEKAQALNLTGTDAEIVTVLKTLTSSDIPVDSLASLLREESLLKWTAEKYVGSIQALVLANSDNVALVDAIDELKSTVFGQSAKKLRTTEPFWAGKVWSIVSMIVGLIPDTAGIVEKVYALDGGRPYKDLTVEQFAAQRTTAENEATTLAARNERRALYDAFENAIGTSEQSEKISEMRTMLNAVEAG
jgi:hypothetical protein